MYSGIFALLCRSLRVDVRSATPHVMRVVLVFAIYLATIRSQALSSFFGAPGLNLFTSMMWLNLIFATLIGISAFSNSITEEKEDDSLGLLKMAGVDSAGLLLGKVGGRLIQALALLVVQYPFALLSITLGGVSIEQIRAIYAALAAYIIMLAGVGVLCSTVSTTSRRASQLMVLFLALYCVVPIICASSLSMMDDFVRPLAQLFAHSSILLQAQTILTTGYSSSLFSTQLISNVVLGIACFLVAWRLFDPCTRNATSEASPRGLLTNKTRAYRWFNPGRVTQDPLGWKDFHFVAGGYVGLLARLGFYISASGILASVAMWNGAEFDNCCAVIAWIIFWVLPIDASLLVGQSLQDEVRGQNIASLVMSPRPIPALVYPKLVGALYGLIPGVSCLVAAILGSRVLVELFKSTWHGPPTEAAMAIFLGFVNFAVFYVLLPHLTAVIAVFARWSATPLAIGCLCALGVVETMIFSTLAMVLAASGDAGIFVLFVMAVCNIAICVLCHYAVLRRFQQLAEQ